MNILLQSLVVHASPVIAVASGGESSLDEETSSTVPIVEKAAASDDDDSSSGLVVMLQAHWNDSMTIWKDVLAGNKGIFETTHGIVAVLLIPLVCFGWGFYVYSKSSNNNNKVIITIQHDGVTEEKQTDDETMYGDDEVGDEHDVVEDEVIDEHDGEEDGNDKDEDDDDDDSDVGFGDYDVVFEQDGSLLKDYHTTGNQLLRELVGSCHTAGEAGVLNSPQRRSRRNRRVDPTKKKLTETKMRDFYATIGDNGGRFLRKKEGIKGFYIMLDNEALTLVTVSIAVGSCDEPIALG